jgi:ubiquinone/menaquinone biosynthesis C-methylase UbiE
MNQGGFMGLIFWSQKLRCAAWRRNWSLAARHLQERCLFNLRCLLSLAFLMSTETPSSRADHSDFKAYASLLSAAHQAFLPEIESLLGDLPLADARRVLDVPCGDGFYSEHLARQLAPGGEVIGIDIDSAALAAARKRAQDHSGTAAIHIHSADVFALPFDEGEFDFVWCAQSLISLSEPTAIPERSSILKALKELYRVLCPGGQIGLLEQDAMHNLLLPWPADLELALQHAQRQGFARLYGHPRQLDVGRQLRKLLALAGFRPRKRMTLAADRQGIPSRELKTFLQLYFRELRRRVEADLSREDLHRFDCLTNPDHDDSFFHDSEWEMTWLEFVSLGIKS